MGPILGAYLNLLEAMPILSSIRNRVSFNHVLTISVAIRVGLIIYSEWHDARSVVKYTDVDYRVFSDATHYLLHPGPENFAEGPLGTKSLGK